MTREDQQQPARDEGEVVLTTIPDPATHPDQDGPPDELRNETPTEQVAKLRQTHQLFGILEPDNEDG